MRLNAVMHEKDHKTGNIIKKQRKILGAGTCCMGLVCPGRTEAHLWETEYHGL